MKNILNHILLCCFGLVLFLGCEEDNTLGTLPSADHVNFSVEQIDDFHWKFTNTSSATGIPNWNLDQGLQVTGDEVIAYYFAPGTYTAKLQLQTAGGPADTEIEIEQPKTDYAYFKSETFTFLTGGVDSTEGKTWVLDETEGGYYALGPYPASDATKIDYKSYFGAAPGVKGGPVFGTSDDEITFNLNGFAVEYDNGPDGKSLIRQEAMTGNDAIYLNPVDPEGNAGYEYVVEYDTPVAGTFLMSEIPESGRDYYGAKYQIKINSSKPIFPCFDAAAENNIYYITKIEENSLWLGYLSPSSNLSFQMKLKPKGYTKPKASCDIDISGTGAENEYAVVLSNVNKPAGVDIKSVKVDFGDGSVMVGKEDGTFTHTFMRKGTYKVVTIVTTSNDEFTVEGAVTIDNFHSQYQEYLLDYTVMYNDFSEVMSIVSAEQGTKTEIVDNPNSSYPNKSAKVLSVEKNGDWDNVEFRLAPGTRFDFRNITQMHYKVMGKKGVEVRLMISNTDIGENWRSAANYNYVIQEDDVWEDVTIDLGGVATGNNGEGWDPDITTENNGEGWDPDITTENDADPATGEADFSHAYYNHFCFFINAGTSGNHVIYLDDIRGPHVEGLKSISLQ